MASAPCLFPEERGALRPAQMKCDGPATSRGLSRHPGPQSWAGHRLSGQRSQDAAQNGFQDLGYLTIPEDRVNHSSPIKCVNSMHTQCSRGKEGTPRVLWIRGWGESGFLAHSDSLQRWPPSVFVSRYMHTAQPIKQASLSSYS